MSKRQGEADQSNYETPKRPKPHDMDVSEGDGAAATRTSTDAQSTGGTSGGGNNSFFHGLGSTTRAPPRELYSKHRDFCRSFHVHANLGEVKPLAEIDFNKTADNVVAGEPVVLGKVNHGCYMIPYTFMEASMKKMDWNQHSNCIGYKVHEFGFTMKNMRIEVMNNDRLSTEAVAPAPPPDCRFFIFVDHKHTYGLPTYITDSKISHSDFFTDEDARNHEHAMMPLQPDRFIVMDPDDAVNMMDRGWETSDAAGKMKHIDPNYLYDIKRQEGYMESLVSAVDLSFSFKTDAQLNLFPRTNSAKSPAMEHFFPKLADSASIVDKSDIYQLREWITHKQLYTAADPAGATYAQILWNNYGEDNYETTEGAAPISVKDQAQYDVLGHGPRMGDMKAEPKATPFGDSAPKFRSTIKHPWITRAGHKVLKPFQGRPPNIYFGIYPEYEIASAKIQKWRYYMCGQIEYHSKVEFVFHDGLYPDYMNVGVGGRYSTVTYAENVPTIPVSTYQDPEKLIWTRDSAKRTGVDYPDGIEILNPGDARNTYIR